MIYAIILATLVGAACICWGWRKGLEPAGLGTSVADNMSSGAIAIAVGVILMLLAGGMALSHWL